MKKLLTLIFLLSVSTNLFAQDNNPLTFLGIRVKDKIENVQAQLIEKGYVPRIKTSKTHYGKYRDYTAKVTVIYSGSNLASAIIVIPVDEDMVSAEEVAKRFNDLLDTFNNDPYYTADPANKRIPDGEDVASEMLNDKFYKAYFYQRGEKTKRVMLSIHKYEGKYYVGENYHHHTKK